MSRRPTPDNQPRASQPAVQRIADNLYYGTGDPPGMRGPAASASNAAPRADIQPPTPPQAYQPRAVATPTFQHIRTAPGQAIPFAQAARQVEPAGPGAGTPRQRIINVEGAGRLGGRSNPPRGSQRGSKP